VFIGTLRALGCHVAPLTETVRGLSNYRTKLVLIYNFLLFSFFIIIFFVTFAEDKLHLGKKKT